jgi:class 3 adenylate cyclase
MERILLVESNATLREWCRLHLSANGYQVTAGDHLGQMLDAARSERSDLAIISTDLPGSNAFVIAATLRSDARTAMTPLLFLVPGDEPETYARALTIAPGGVLTKPFGWPVLREAVRARLGSEMTGGGGTDTPALSAWGSSPLASPGMLVESRSASVLFVSLRNLVTLARSVRGRTLETLLQKFVTDSRDAVLSQGGWVVRADATGLLALFEDGPNMDRTHSTRAFEAAMAAMLTARRVKTWAHATLSDAFIPQISIGCGIDSGEVIVARLSLGGTLVPSVAGPAVDVASRLDGRAKGLGWSIGVSEASALLAGNRFQLGRRATVTDADHGTIPIVEVTGFNPGTARPGELIMMTEAREAILSNGILASLAGDAEPDEADRTIVVGGALRPPEEYEIGVPHRKILKRVGQGSSVTGYQAVHEHTGRDEFVKVIPVREVPDGFIEQYLDDYRRIAALDQRNILSVFEIGRTEEIAFVATEFLPGGNLESAIRKRLPIGLSLNYLAQMSFALDALHGLDLFHGSLGAEHFLFRKERVVVLADFNTTERALRTARRENLSASERETHLQEGRRADFRALGLILSALLRGDTPARNGAQSDGGLTGSLRLPEELAALRPCLDGLLGTGRNRAFERAEEVLVELMTVREVFPFDMRAGDPDNAPLLP